MMQKLETIVGSNSNYYVPIFRDMQSTGKRLRWNWAGFFFGNLWFLYRKIWLVELPLFFITLVAVVALSTLELIGFIIVVGLSLNLLAATLGTWIYFRWLLIVVGYLERRYSGEDLERQLKRYGGVLQ